MRRRGHESRGLCGGDSVVNRRNGRVDTAASGVDLADDSTADLRRVGRLFDDPDKPMRAYLRSQRNPA